MKSNKVDRRCVLLAALVFVAAVAGFTYKTHQFNSKYRPKESFESARITLIHLHASIEEDLGRVGVSEKSESCGRPNLKAGEGDLSCSVGIDYAYAVSDIYEADKLVNRIGTTLKDKPQISVMGEPKSLIEAFEQTTGSQLAETRFTFYDTQTSMRCTAHFRYVPKGAELPHFTIADPSSNNLDASISCGGYARGEYYPVR